MVVNANGLFGHHNGLHNKHATMGDGTAQAALVVAIAALVLVLGGGVAFWLSAKYLVNEQDIPWRVQAVTVHLQKLDADLAKSTHAVEKITALINNDVAAAAAAAAAARRAAAATAAAAAARAAAVGSGIAIGGVIPNIGTGKSCWGAANPPNTAPGCGAAAAPKGQRFTMSTMDVSETQPAYHADAGNCGGSCGGLGGNVLKGALGAGTIHSNGGGLFTSSTVHAVNKSVGGSILVCPNFATTPVPGQPMPPVQYPVVLDATNIPFHAANTFTVPVRVKALHSSPSGKPDAVPLSTSVGYCYWNTDFHEITLPDGSKEFMLDANAPPAVLAPNMSVPLSMHVLGRSGAVDAVTQLPLGSTSTTDTDGGRVMSWEAQLCGSHGTFWRELGQSYPPCHEGASLKANLPHWGASLKSKLGGLGWGWGGWGWWKHPPIKKILHHLEHPPIAGIGADLCVCSVSGSHCLNYFAVGSTIQPTSGSAEFTLPPSPFDDNPQPTSGAAYNPSVSPLLAPAAPQDVLSAPWKWHHSTMGVPGPFQGSGIVEDLSWTWGIKQPWCPALK